MNMNIKAQDDIQYHNNQAILKLFGVNFMPTIQDRLYVSFIGNEVQKGIKMILRLLIVSKHKET